ncbi:ExeA family protein [Marinimicrobium sp. ABcell2]|uniref:ExeA family protein n=1 Tax=Marinimicrobium sp. ABcell2 TaxID=3069751 RepID=UPI0027B0D279|nr:AAA family ATPase [Marinimicrobium sp. ABcell2]MDQ2075223.1 AAA family ATPase [Marinimicrobium sp. ABcell2]
MYQQHFGLRELPFSLTPDTQFFFDNQSHREVLNTLLLALRHSEGFIKIVGEVGTGKTLLSRKLLASLGPEFVTAYIPNPYLTPDELKWFLAEEIGVTYSRDTPSYELLTDIYRQLVAMAKRKRRVVLIVDEAQAMPRETIEALRLLTNLETEKSKLLQVILLGQPELDDLLNRPDLRQLKQRIVFAEYLDTVRRSSLPAYIQFRLSSAGYQGPPLFTRSALNLLYRASGGVPRLINIIAHKAMLATYGLGRERVGRRQVARAALDTAESRSLGRWLARYDYWLWGFTGAVTALALMGLIAWSGVGQGMGLKIASGVGL